MKEAGFLMALLLLAAAPGLAGDGVVALQTADPSCPDDSGNIYVDCGNGTVTDNRTGLVWLAKGNCFGETVPDWSLATELVSNLADLDVAFCVAQGLTAEQCDCGLSDNSSPGEWRLPTADEWKTMVSDAIGDAGDPDCTATPPTITDDTGEFCYLAGSSFDDVVAGYYYSASIDMLFPTTRQYLVNLGSGSVTSEAGIPVAIYAWPVRGGQ